MPPETVGPPSNADELFDPEKEPAPQFLDRPQRANDPKALQEKALKDKSRDLQDENDLRAVLATREGIRFVVRLLLACGIDQPVFQANNSLMCEVAGRRSIANQLRDWVKNVGLKEWFAVEEEFENYRPKPKTSERGPKTRLPRG
jgi:hypothetical protein